MALLTEKILFIHVPRTGGTWSRKMITDHITTPWSECGYFHSTLHDEGVSAMLPCRFSFAFVRNPVTWYASQWASPIHRGRIKDKNLLHPNDIQNEEEENNFNVWLARMLRDFPGRYSALCKQFFGDYYNSLNYIGKYENLTSDLITVLIAAGETFDHMTILSSQKINTSVAEFRDRVNYTNPLLEQLIDQEQEIMKFFGYPTDPAVYFSDAKTLTRPVRPKLL